MIRAFILTFGAATLIGCSHVSITDDTCMIDPMKGRAVLFRGLLNIFSTGMNDLAARMRLCGIDAESTHHTDWRDVVHELKQNPPKVPLVLAGHSLGADAAISVANSLDEAGVRVEAIVTIDPFSPPMIDDNTVRVLNLYQRDGWSHPLSQEVFSGEITNIDVSTLPWGSKVTHFNIDDTLELHRAILDYLTDEAGMSAGP